MDGRINHAVALAGAHGEVVADETSHPETTPPHVAGPACLVARLDGCVSFAADAIGERVALHVDAALGIANPAYIAAERADRSTHGIRRRLSPIRREGNRFVLPRGCATDLRAACEAEGVALRWEDSRVFPVERIECTVPTVRKYQGVMVEALVGAQQGIGCGPAGCGKTRIACALIGRLRTPTLIICGQIDLVTQTADVVRACLGIEPGIIAAGTDTRGPVVVATVQSLAAMDRARLAELLESVGLLMVDECHHAASETYREILDACPARYRIGLTATPDRADGLGALVRWQIGRIVHRIAHGDLIAEGHLSAPTRVELRTDYAYPYGGPDDWLDLTDAIWRDERRNALILDEVARRVAEGHVVIMLTGRVEHCAELAKAITARGIAAEALTGQTRKKERARILDAAREGSVRVIVATQLADEGLDVPRLSCAVLAFPARAAGRIEQRIGRIMRPHPDAPAPVVIDVVDPEVGVLAWQAAQRARVYARIVGGAA